MSSVNSGTIPASLMVDGNLLGQGGQTSDFLKNATTTQSTDGAMQCSSHETSDAQQKLQTFWQTQMDEIQNITTNEFKTQELPLARIKKIMKMDDDVKMISAEAPLLFSKAAQIFITELSLRAWIHTEESKRRTLQRNDIATAITKFDQFDFLIDIVPREEIKPSKRSYGMTGSDGMQFYYTVPQQSSGTATTTNSVASMPQVSALQSGQLVMAQPSQNGQPVTLTPVNLDGNQVLQLSQPAQQAVQSASAQNLQKQDSAATVDKTQNAQAVLQQIINSLPNSSPGDVHTIQMNSQGQLQLVKMASPQNPGSGGAQRLVAGGSNQVFELATNIAGTSQQTEANSSSTGHGVNTIYVGQNN